LPIPRGRPAPAHRGEALAQLHSTRRTGGVDWFRWREVFRVAFEVFRAKQAGEFWRAGVGLTPGLVGPACNCSLNAGVAGHLFAAAAPDPWRRRAAVVMSHAAAGRSLVGFGEEKGGCSEEGGDSSFGGCSSKSTSVGGNSSGWAPGRKHRGCSASGETSAAPDSALLVASPPQKRQRQQADHDPQRLLAYTLHVTPELNLSLHSDPGSSWGYCCGNCMWSAATVLVDHLAAEARGGGSLNLRGSRVIELGCGLGAPGLAAAGLGATEVLLTDVARMMPLLRYNIAQNAYQCAGATPDRGGEGSSSAVPYVHAAELDWNTKRLPPVCNQAW
jgi:hypothetical protein